MYIINWHEDKQINLFTPVMVHYFLEQLPVLVSQSTYSHFSTEGGASEYCFGATVYLLPNCS